MSSKERENPTPTPSRMGGAYDVVVALALALVLALALAANLGRAGEVERVSEKMRCDTVGVQQTLLPLSPLTS